MFSQVLVENLPDNRDDKKQLNPLGEQRALAWLMRCSSPHKLLVSSGGL